MALPSGSSGAPARTVGEDVSNPWPRSPSLPVTILLDVEGRSALRSVGMLSRKALLPLALLAAGCSKEPDEAPVQEPNPFQEVVDQGATRYFGKTQVTEETKDDAGVITYTFDPSSGPVCLKGEPYQMSVRDTGSEDLFIFLQGGGACWSTFCLAINEAQYGIPAKLDILDPDKPTNPVAGWSTVFFPYCDGSLFAGDADHDDDGDGTPDRRQRGLANLSAGLDVAATRFPSPKRIVLAGSSGGGYGTILATLLVRSKFPGVELLVFDDAGVGLGRPGDEAFISGLFDEWNARSLLPKTCEGCTATGHITRLVGWGLERDPKLTVATFSSYRDYVISDVFLGLDADTFRGALLEETGAVHAAWPDRYRRFLVDSAVHTTLLGGLEGLVGNNFGAVTFPPDLATKLGEIELGGIDSTQVRGVTTATWFKAMIEGSAEWDDRLE